MGKLTGADLDRFHALGVGTVIDLRYPWEIAARGRAPQMDGLAWHNLSIEHRTYDQATIDPTLDPWRYLADRYAEVAEDGVAELRQALELVAADFARTELATARLIADWQALNPDRELLWPGFGRAPETIIRHFLADLTAAYGSVVGYATDRLGVDEALTARLRDRLLSE
ncbi:tyrosine-protein phosphatase [Micromonospora sp. DT4]|uniref:tyrosine-protein phosphatase n=1 Tax=Micromonospora sp. DT4 TaxID=3393438 RepID=UPI003CF55177